MLQYDPSAPAMRSAGKFLEALADDDMNVMCDDEPDDQLLQIENAAGQNGERAASFGLSQGLLIPGVKHLFHNTQDDMLKGLRHYVWFTDPCWITSVAAYAMCCGFYFFTGVSAMMMGARRRIINNTTST